MASKADGKDRKIFIDLLKKYSQTDQIKVGHLIDQKYGGPLGSGM